MGIVITKQKYSKTNKKKGHIRYDSQNQERVGI